MDFLNTVNDSIVGFQNLASEELKDAQAQMEIYVNELMD